MEMPDARAEPHAPLTAMRSPRIFCTGLCRRIAAATWSAFCWWWQKVEPSGGGHGGIGLSGGSDACAPRARTLRAAICGAR
jgi:hypothetical protein